MPTLIQNIDNHMRALIDHPPKALDIAYVDRINGQMCAEMHGWSVSAMAVIRAVVKDPLHTCRSQITLHNLNLANDPGGTSAKLLEMLKRLKADFEAGTLSDHEDHVCAQDLHDLLGHAQLR